MIERVAISDIRNGKRMYVPVAAFENWLAGAGQFSTWPVKDAG